MDGSPPPVPLVASALAVIPAPVLARLVAFYMRGLRRRHPNLIRNFGRLDPAVVHVAPTDLPHRFAIAFGDGRMAIRVITEARPAAPDATISASLAVLIDLLEGRIDGDTMFFTRDLRITGSTVVIVAVRNTLDGEELVMRDDVAALFGPLERPARRVARLVRATTGRVRAQVAAAHARLHAEDAGGRDLAAELDSLRAEMKALQTRLAKLDVRKQRGDLAATGVP